MMNIKSGNFLPDLSVISPYIFKDFRGCYVETFNEEEYDKLIYKKYNMSIKFVQDDISVSSQNVLRGLHGDDRTWKLIQCLKGAFCLAIVDMRKSSETYLKWELIELNEENRKQVLVPPGFVNGHLCISDVCIFSYKQSTYYEGAKKQMTVMWDDPVIGINWPTDSPILSERDKTARYLNVE